MINQPTIFRSPVVRSGFSTANPVDFAILDDEGNQAVYILNDQSPGRTHHLVLVNNSETELLLQSSGGNHIPSSVNNHFELRFRPGTLDPEFLSWLNIITGGWRMRVEMEAVELVASLHNGIHSGTVSVYLLFVGEEELKILPGKPLVLVLQHVKASLHGGSRGSRVELRYQTDGKELLTAPAESLRCFRQERLQIINHRGKKELPMIAAFEGSSTVLNDGATANNLVLQISNFLHNSTIALNARDSESPTKLILSFDTSEEHAAWALCDPDNASAIDVELHFEKQEGTNWHIRPELQGNNPQWVITLLDDLELRVGEYFHLHLEGLKTSMPSGFTTLYLLYENIPGFWDGRFEIPIEKSPLRFDDVKKNEDHRQDGSFIQKTKVGIGNTEPVDTLDVNGGVQAEMLVLRNGKPFSKKEGEDVFPLEVQGKIRAEGLTLSGKVVTESSSIADLEVSKSLTLGTVKVTEEGSSKNLKVEGRLKDSTGFVIPPGGIIMWSGTDVPEGWKLCDGSNGTPDLRSRFIVGAGQGSGNDDRGERLTNYPVNTTGGRKNHVLSLGEMPSHAHTITINQDGAHSHAMGSRGFDTSGELGADGSTDDTSLKTHEAGAHSHAATIHSAGGDQAHENRPPFWALAFIMKM